MLLNVVTSPEHKFALSFRLSGEPKAAGGLRFRQLSRRTITVASRPLGNSVRSSAWRPSAESATTG